MNGFVRKAFTPRLKRLNLAALMMHEGGHSLGLSPWTIEGCDNLSYIDGRAAENAYKETWGNYRSVMNYYYVYDYSVVDYSSGDDATYDQNDWASLFLPTFQIEATVIEAPDFEVPGKDVIVLSMTEPEMKGWGYDENLTLKAQDQLRQLFVLENVDASVKWLANNIPYSIIKEALEFFKAIYLAEGSEGVVLLTYDNNEWEIKVPKQAPLKT
jgi:hypothetical protein